MELFKQFRQEQSNNSKALLIAVLFFILGLSIGYNNQPAINKITSITGKETAVETTADFSPFWKAWNILNEKYPDNDKVSDQDRVYGAISGLASSLNDPYTTFFKPTESKAFQDDIAGSFSGIGVEIGLKDKILTVIAPLKDTPGYKAGLKPGDKILKIDSTTTNEMSVEKAISLIRGERGTTVSLTIVRVGEQKARELKIVRDVINVPTIETKLRPDGVFVITLYSFSGNSTNLFRAALKEFTESHTDKLVLDLRGNPGGYLDAAVDISSWFLPSGKTVVIEDFGKDQKQKIYRSNGYDIFTDKLKFVILIDGGSASASEIVAGAMQDYGIAKLVGMQSYGKGSVQEVVQVTSNTILKVTVAKWLTPNGTSISLKGLTPDYEVDFTGKDADAKRDPQMDKAVQVLNSMK